MLGLLLFASVALFPTILLPSSPSMWMAGLTFGYGKGFLLILSAASIGVTLPFLIGHLFLHKMQVSIITVTWRILYVLWFIYLLSFRWSPAGMVEAIPEKGSNTSSSRWRNLVSSVSSSHVNPCLSIPLHDLQLLRIGHWSSLRSLHLRLPCWNGSWDLCLNLHVFVLYLSVYISVSMWRHVLQNLELNWYFLIICRGIMLRTLAVASDVRHSLSAVEIVVNVLGFCVTASATIVCTIYAKKKLSSMQSDEVETLPNV